MKHYGSHSVRSALMKFFLGKVFSGLLGLLAFILVVRGLPNADFGAYATFLALQASLTVFSTLGVEAATERYIPELRVSGQAQDVQGLILLGLLVRLLILLVVIAVIYVARDVWLPWIGMQAHADVLAFVLAWVALYSVLQTSLAILEALLHQGSSQVVQSLLSLVKVAALLALPWLSGALTLRQVVMVEAASSGLALLVALALLQRGWGGVRVSFGHALAGLQQQPGLLGRMRRFAAFNYGAQLVMLAYGADYMRFLLARVNGLAETARFGFVYSLYDYVQRYLPATLLIRLIRPVFVAKYAESKDFSQLNAFANIILKLNLLVLVPAFVVILGAGDVAVQVISKGKYADTHFLLLAYFLLLVPMSHQWVVSIVANTLEINALQFRGALLALLGAVVSLTLVHEWGAWACIAGAWVSALIYNAHAIWFFRKKGYLYKVDRLAALKFLGAAVVGSLPLLALMAWPAGPVGKVLLALAASLVALAALFVLKPFTPSERQLLNKVLPKPVFVF